MYGCIDVRRYGCGELNRLPGRTEDALWKGMGSQEEWASIEVETWTTYISLSWWVFNSIHVISWAMTMRKVGSGLRLLGSADLGAEHVSQVRFRVLLSVFLLKILSCILSVWHHGLISHRTPHFINKPVKSVCMEHARSRIPQLKPPQQTVLLEVNHSRS